MKKNKNSDARPGLYERVYEREADRRVSEAEAQALKLEAYERTAANRRNRSIVRALLAFVIVIMLIGALTYAVYRLLFVITEIEVSGNVSYSAEELISASGVSEGDNLYSFSSRVAGEKEGGLPLCKKPERQALGSEQDNLYGRGIHAGVFRRHLRRNHLSSRAILRCWRAPRRQSRRGFAG